MKNGGPAESEAAGAGILEAGTRLGKYEIRRLIGLGSMSAIYEGARPDTGRRVALKVLSPTRAGVPGARARFLTEAKLTARVRHAHIVDVIEVGEDGERSYLAMEMLEGEDLARRLGHSGPLSPAETADLLVPVCDAVAAAHASGIVHRDLKPSNIFLAIRDQKTHPVVLDFGIANDNDAAGTEAGTSKDARAVPGQRLVFGTPYYLSPEQVTDHRAASPASDQWALGVILYECLTGARPFDGETLDEVFAAIAAGKPVPPGERRPGIPPELGQVVMRAMILDPKARFPSVAELAQALRPFRSGGDEARSPLRRRVPSSPAIEVEASKQSPFARTLTPEVDVLDGLWFEPDAAEEAAGDPSSPDAGSSGADASIAAASNAAERPPSSEAWVTLASPWTESWRSVSSRRSSARRFLRRFPGRRIGAAAGGALGGLALLFLFARGGSTHREVAASPGVPTTPASVKELPVATEPPRERSAIASSLSAAKESTVRKEAVPVAVPEAVPVAVPVAVKEPTAAEPVAKPPVTPAASRSVVAESRVRTSPAAPTAAATTTGSPPHDAAERPRARTNPEIRMHKGVPLLD